MVLCRSMRSAAVLLKRLTNAIAGDRQRNYIILGEPRYIRSRRRSVLLTATRKLSMTPLPLTAIASKLGIR